MVLVPEVVKAVAPTPVLAAGGIGTGAQIAAALALGAQGVWMGSIWLATAESNSSPEGIEAYMEATSSDTVRSRSYTGKPARMLRNAWTDAWEDPDGPGPLGMPLQNILTAEANARIAARAPQGPRVRARRPDRREHERGEAGTRRDVPAGRGVHRGHRAADLDARHRRRLSCSPHSAESGAVPSLIDLRVLDLSTGIAGAYGTKILADLGADATKVEPAGGARLRTWSAATPDVPVTGTGALFAFLHELVTVRSADAVDVAPRWRTPTSSSWTKALRPSSTSRARSSTRRGEASVVTISSFGADGPLAGAPADEFVLQAWCGLMSGCGTAATPPLQMGVGHGQWATGAMAALAALAGDAWRARTGEGADVEVSALEVMAVCLLNYPMLYRHFTGSVAVMSRGGDWPQIVRCKDGWIGLCLFTPQQWDDFAGMIGRPDLTGDERLNSMGGAASTAIFAQSVIRPWLDEHTADGDLRARRTVPRPRRVRRERPRRARDGPLPRARRVRAERRRLPAAPLPVPRANHLRFGVNGESYRTNG